MKLLAHLLRTTVLFGIVFPFPKTPQPLSLEYISPVPYARNISPNTSIAIRQGYPFAHSKVNAELFYVVGSISGVHSGEARLADDHLTLLFYPDEAFAHDETVSVSVEPGLTTVEGTPIAGIDYQFSTMSYHVPKLDEINQYMMDTPDSNVSDNKAIVSDPPRFYTYPEFSSVMTTTVTTLPNQTGEGDIFIAQLGILPTQSPHLLIVGDDGEPIYINRFSSDLAAADFKVQTVNDIPYLVYSIGTLRGGYSSGTYFVMDNTYTIIDSWTIGNGYGADFHDLQLMKNGHALLLSYVPIPWDLSPYEGPVDGTVLDIVIQEQDSEKNVVFDWHASQHIPLTDTYRALDESPLDYVHTNAIELDDDGNILISSRHISEITKIDRHTGEIIWRLGGKKNQFTFTNDIGFSYQHDIRRLPNGKVTLFDNGNQHDPPFSRAVEYEIGEATKTITRTWQYPEDTSIYAQFMGNSQQLPNGNSVIGWGAIPKVTEVHPDGTKAFELALGDLTYRGFRFPWTSFPAEKPRTALLSTNDPDEATVFLSWNGATNISAYEVYAGPTPESMSVVTTTLTTGFESSITLTDLNPATCVFKARPIHEKGLTTPFSLLTYRLDLPHCRELLEFNYLPLIMQ